MIRVRQFCCGCTLKTGCFIIAILALIGCFYEFWTAMSLPSQIDNWEKLCSEVKEAPYCSPEVIKLLRASISYYYAFASFGLIIGFTLLFGVITENPFAIMVNIVLNIIEAAASFIIFCIFMGPIAIPILIIPYGIIFYFLVVLYSFYCEINDKNSGLPM